MLYKLFKEIIARLEPLYGVGEANAIARRLLEDGYGISRKDLMLNPQMVLNADIEASIRSGLRELEREKPVQYVVGFEEFLGRRFRVNESVLIPRQETEELVMLVGQECRAYSPLRILDIGTGSGAIAVSLALEFANAEVTGWDISAEALSVAIDNAQALGAKVCFEQVDILNSGVCNRTWDVIVSNPPYVLNSEKEYMKSNVTKYEPGLALFVDDDDPLIFYRAIAGFAEGHLNSGGRLYFEINQKFGNETVELLSAFESVEVVKDIHGADRIVTCNAGD